MTYKELDAYYIMFKQIEKLMIQNKVDRKMFKRFFKLRVLVYDCFTGSPEDEWALSEKMNDAIFRAKTWEEYYRRLESGGIKEPEVRTRGMKEAF